MIVRPHGGAWLLITQPAHAALAGRIMRDWHEPALRLSPRRDAILLAVTDHDNGWTETDRAPVLDAATGRVLDFVALPAPLRQDVWPRGVARLRSTPYAAALVAHHAVHVYSRFRSDPGWTQFFREMERLRDEHLWRSGGVSLEQLLADYQFVRAGDLISLAFCNDWREPQNDGFGRTVHFDGTRVIVRPDPFGGRTIEIQVTGRELVDAAFASEGAASDALERAPLRTIAGTVAGS